MTFRAAPAVPLVDMRSAVIVGCEGQDGPLLRATGSKPSVDFDGMIGELVEAELAR